MLRLSSVVRWIGRSVMVARTRCAISTRISGSDAVAHVVDGVEAQPVEAELVQPVERVLDEESPHRRRLVGDGRAPGRLRGLIEEVAGA